MLIAGTMAWVYLCDPGLDYSRHDVLAGVCHWRDLDNRQDETKSVKTNEMIEWDYLSDIADFNSGQLLSLSPVFLS